MSSPAQVTAAFDDDDELKTRARSMICSPFSALLAAYGERFAAKSSREFIYLWPAFAGQKTNCARLAKSAEAGVAVSATKHHDDDDDHWLSQKAAAEATFHVSGSFGSRAESEMSSHRWNELNGNELAEWMQMISFAQFSSVSF